jgi:hypothetical protein
MFFFISKSFLQKVFFKTTVAKESQTYVPIEKVSAILGEAMSALRRPT